MFKLPLVVGALISMVGLGGLIQRPGISTRANPFATSWEVKLFGTWCRDTFCWNGCCLECVETRMNAVGYG